MRIRQNTRPQQRPGRSHKKIILISVVGVVVVAGVIATLELTNTTHFFHSKKTDYTTAPNSSHRTANANTKGETNSDATSPSTNATTNSGGQATKDTNTGATDTTNVELKAPTGTFVSNHHPNLSGSPAPNQIQSVCNTTSGATCQIIFTKDGVTKTLPTQATDKGGAAYWTWKLQDIGLTAGSWKVQAKATLGTQTQTADDAATLEVAQ